MKILFEENEFTSNELLNYLKAAYRLKINGSAFSHHNINNWIRNGKIPEAYGNHKILNVEISKAFCNRRILTIDGLTRDVLDDLHLLRKAKKFPPIKRIRKQRTELYFQILAKAGKQYTKKTKELSTLPNNWKQLGIKPNQLRRRKSQLL
jgi:hypothetical protein